ncbi:MAG: hypothetical protein C0403_04135 [Desulfobacterium sp.]|nr:hypothetical protein [Desulfobacterium sp.]
MAIKKISRRIFIKISGMFLFFLSFVRIGMTGTGGSEKKPRPKASKTGVPMPLGTDAHGISHVYLVKGMTPENNIKRVMKVMGGCEKFIGIDDIVILKPNAQWWHHGTTNTNNMKGFIELVFGIRGFQGEVIIAENHHYKEANARGWNTKDRNGDYNLNELIDYFHQKGYENISKYHWVDAGSNPKPQEGDGGNGNLVKSVTDGDGYIWLDDKVYETPCGRKCMMTYPVFTSVYSGKKIDLCRGSLVNGKYVKNVKLINFSCLNHHSEAFGVTASIKNLMGVTDMTCGFHGPEPSGMYNMHFIGRMSSIYKAGLDLKYYGEKFGFGPGLGRKLMDKGYWDTQYTGGALGYWMKHVKMPDLNILAAEYVGWGGRGRNGPDKRHRANCVVCSTDPVALDYVGSKKILLEATPEEETHYRKFNSPDYPPFRTFLEECHQQGIGNLDVEKIKVIVG